MQLHMGNMQDQDQALPSDAGEGGLRTEAYLQGAIVQRVDAAMDRQLLARFPGTLDSWAGAHIEHLADGIELHQPENSITVSQLCLYSAIKLWIIEAKLHGFTTVSHHVF